MKIVKKLPNDVFAELDGSRRMINITDRLNLGELEVDDISKNYGRRYKKICTNQVN